MSAPSSLDNQTPASPWVLFGIDLSTVGQDWLRAMRQLYQIAPLRWFELNPSIQVLRNDGHVAQWQSNQLHPAVGNAPTKQAPFTAIELPESLILRRALNLPDLPSAQIHDAVALDLMSSSPFQADDIAWGYVQTTTEAGGVQIHSAFASRTQIAQYLSSATAQHAWPSDSSEVWVFAPGNGQPIILQGYGEAIAEHARNQRRLRAGAALVLLAALVIAAAITPTLQVRHQAIQAEQAYQQLQAQTSQLSEERAQFTKALDSVAQIKSYNEQRINPLEVLELLSDVLPKDVSVVGLKIEDQSVELTAEADNAAAIIQTLGELKTFAEVRTTRPVQQVAQAKKERFTVEMRIEPGAFNVKFSEEDMELPEEVQEVQEDATTLSEEKAPAAPAEAASSLQNSADPVGSSTAVIGGGTARRGQSSAGSGVAPPPAPPQPLKPQAAVPSTPSADPETVSDNTDTETSNQDQTGSEDHLEQDGNANQSMADEEELP